MVISVLPRTNPNTNVDQAITGFKVSVTNHKICTVLVVVAWGIKVNTPSNQRLSKSTFNMIVITHCCIELQRPFTGICQIS